MVRHRRQRLLEGPLHVRRSAGAVAAAKATAALLAAALGLGTGLATRVGLPRWPTVAPPRAPSTLLGCGFEEGGSRAVRFLRCCACVLLSL